MSSEDKAIVAIVACVVAMWVAFFFAAAWSDVAKAAAKACGQ